MLVVEAFPAGSEGEAGAPPVSTAGQSRTRGIFGASARQTDSITSLVHLIMERVQTDPGLRDLLPGDGHVDAATVQAYRRDGRGRQCWSCPSAAPARPRRSRSRCCAGRSGAVIVHQYRGQEVTHYLDREDDAHTMLQRILDTYPPAGPTGEDDGAEAEVNFHGLEISVIARIRQRVYWRPRMANDKALVQ